MAPTSLYQVQIEELAGLAQPDGGTPVACPVCGSTATRPRFRIVGIESEIRDCLTCGLGWMDPLPSPDALDSFYPSHYYGAEGVKFRRWIEWAIRVVGARRLRFLTSRLHPGAAVLDVGCGRGVLLRQLAQRGYRAYGTERSTEAGPRSDLGAEIRYAATLREADFPSAFFDQVILWHVFEHLPDPRPTLDEIHRLLKPGGSVVIAVPNYSSWQARWAGADWFHLDPPRHLYHFSTDSLDRMLTDAGFTVRSWHHFSLRQNPFGWVQSALNRWNPKGRNRLYSWLLREDDGVHAGSAAWRAILRSLAFAAGMPPAIALEVLAAIFRRGATVHLIATRSSH